MRYAYYHRLSRRMQAVYRKSDALDEVALARPSRYTAAVAAIFSALGGAQRKEVERTSRALVSLLLRELQVPPVTVRVLSRRPSSPSTELHGLYEREEGVKPIIRVWMRTAANGHVVAPRTFLRTLLHEVCHHLDYELFRLDDSFHTEGFFRREASLARQLLPRRESRTRQGANGVRRVRHADRVRPSATRAGRPVQLDLPLV